jgi:hypothetical protein
MRAMVDVLAERLDGLERQVSARPFAVLVELALVRARPLDHEPAAPRRQLAGDDDQLLDVDRGLIVAVGCVEVGSTEMMNLVVSGLLAQRRAQTASPGGNIGRVLLYRLIETPWVPSMRRFSPRWCLAESPAI